MHKLQYLLSLIPVLLVAGIAHAGDKEDIEAAHDALFAAWNANDVEAAQKFYAPGCDMFQPDGHLLQEFDWSAARKWHESGGKINVGTPLYRHIKIYGNTAILTYYTSFKITFPDSTTVDQTRRNTAVMAKNDGEWKYVHYHASLLTPENPD